MIMIMFNMTYHLIKIHCAWMKAPRDILFGMYIQIYVKNNYMFTEICIILLWRLQMTSNILFNTHFLQKKIAWVYTQNTSISIFYYKCLIFWWTGQFKCHGQDTIPNFIKKILYNEFLINYILPWWAKIFMTLWVIWGHWRRAKINIAHTLNAVYWSLLIDLRG